MRCSSVILLIGKFWSRNGNQNGHSMIIRIGHIQPLVLSPLMIRASGHDVRVLNYEVFWENGSKVSCGYCRTTYLLQIEFENYTAGIWPRITYFVIANLWPFLRQTQNSMLRYWNLNFLLRDPIFMCLGTGSTVCCLSSISFGRIGSLPERMFEFKRRP